MKAFDCTSYSLINAKIQTYGFNKDVFVLSYVVTNNVKRDFQILYFGCPSRSIVGPVLVNCHHLMMHHLLFAWSVSAIMKLLVKKSNRFIEWYKTNQVTVIPYKFPAVVID